MPRLFAALLLALLATGIAAQEAAKSKPEAQPAVAERTARVAGGGTVTLAASTLGQAELAARRPRYEDLKPRLHDGDR